MLSGKEIDERDAMTTKRTEARVAEELLAMSPVIHDLKGEQLEGAAIALERFYELVRSKYLSGGDAQ